MPGEEEKSVAGRKAIGRGISAGPRLAMRKEYALIYEEEARMEADREILDSIRNSLHLDTEAHRILAERLSEVIKEMLFYEKSR